MFYFFFFNDTATTEIYTLSLHDALPISPRPAPGGDPHPRRDAAHRGAYGGRGLEASLRGHRDRPRRPDGDDGDRQAGEGPRPVTAHLRRGGRRTDGPGTASGRNLHAGGRRAARGSGAPDGNRRPRGNPPPRSRAALRRPAALARAAGHRTGGGAPPPPPRSARRPRSQACRAEP